MTPLLQVQGLHASYGSATAVVDVSMTVAPGEIVSIIGANGAGKTTLLNSLMGLHRATGNICFRGEPIDRLETEARLERGLCLVPEARELFGAMTVEDNLVLGGYSKRRGARRTLPQRLDDVYLRFPRLKERRNQLAGTLSGGERQMLAIGRALMCEPELLMLDEPSLGLAPIIVAEMFSIIVRLRATGVSILLVEQNARAALSIADHAIVLELGTVAIDGPGKSMMNDPRIVESYLGAARK